MKQEKIGKVLKQAIKYYKRRQYHSASKKFSWVLERDKENEIAKYFLNLINSDYVIEEQLLETLKYDPNSLSSYRKLLEMYSNNPVKSKGILEEIIRLEMDELKLLEAKEELARVLEKLGNFDEAIKVYEELSSEDQDFQDYYWQIGNIFLKKGDVESSVKMLSLALEKARKM